MATDAGGLFTFYDVVRVVHAGETQMTAYFYDNLSILNVLIFSVSTGVFCEMYYNSDINCDTDDGGR